VAFDKELMMEKAGTIIPAIVEACSSFVVVLDQHRWGAVAFMAILLIGLAWAAIFRWT
jgi:hypothetical protein